MKIAIANRQRHLPISSAKVQRIAKHVLKHFQLKKARLNILFLDDEAMSELHKCFLGKGGSTDVLAFGMQEGRSLRGDPHLLGDIAISAERALSQSKRLRVSVEKELALYVIHGILHLLGYDDHDRRSRLFMRRKEKELLKAMKVNGL